MLNTDTNYQKYYVNNRFRLNTTNNFNNNDTLAGFDSRSISPSFTSKNSTKIDTFVYNDKSNNKTQENFDPPKVSIIRATTGFLSQDQVDKINDTRKLPDNLKIMQTGIGGYYLTYNSLVDISHSLHTVPDGYELKKDITGYVHVVPIA